MTVHLKLGVDLHGCAPVVFDMIAKCHPVMSRYGEFWVTSAKDGTHKETSLHYQGKAIDIRTRHMKPHEVLEAAQDIKRALGPGYDVVIEHAPPHLHIEYDPKG